MTLIQTHEQLLESIDLNCAALQSLALQQPSVRVSSWLNHFNHLWAVLRDQAGWTPIPSRRRQWLERLFPLRQFTPDDTQAPALMSPIWDQENLYHSFPPDVTTYPTAYGFKFSSCGLDFWQVLATGHYSTELPETLLMLRLLPAIETFVDVGANIGFYSLLIAAQSAGRVPVVSYEPCEENFKTLLHTIRLNGLQDQIKAERKAVGNLTGEADLYLSASGSGGHSLLSRAPSTKIQNREHVPVLPLDQTRLDHRIENKKTLIKIDVEGFEQAVFEGAGAWMACAQPPIFLFEAWPPSKALPGPTLETLMNQLWQCRYVVFAIETLKDGSRLLRKLTKGTIEPAPIGNYLALPEWALPVLPELNKPVDIRLFTETQRLEAANAFLARSLEALQRHLTANTAGSQGESTR